MCSVITAETKMSIFSDFFNSEVPRMDPLPPSYRDTGKMFSFVKIYRFFVGPLTISQNFISISFLVKTLSQKTFGEVHSFPPLGGLGSKQLLSSRWPKSALCLSSFKTPRKYPMRWWSEGDETYRKKVCAYIQLYLAQLAFDAMNINDAIISKRRNISKSQSQKLVNESILFLSGTRSFLGPTSIQGVFMPSMALGGRLIWGTLVNI